MTPIALLIRLCGLSQAEAAAYLSVSPSSIDKMTRKVRATPVGILNDLRTLIAKQKQAANEALALIKEKKPPEIEIGYPADDHEAQSLGWPCVGAWAAMVAHVIASIDVSLELVPRGSTSATASAMDELEKPDLSTG